MGFKFDKYDPEKLRPELPSVVSDRQRREHPEWYGPEPVRLTAEERREMDKEAGSRGDITAGFKQREVPAYFPVRETKGDLENDRPAAKPDPSPFKLGR